MKNKNYPPYDFYDFCLDFIRTAALIFGIWLCFKIF